MSTTDACEGCGTTPAGMVCPTCRQLGLYPSRFCSQDCFKKNWNTHKAKHTPTTKKEIKITDPVSAEAKSQIDERFRGYRFTGPLRPGKVSSRLSVPPHIPRPDYANTLTGEPLGEREAKAATIHVHTPDEIEKMRKACLLARKVQDLAASMIRVGITTDEIDVACHKAIIEADAYPSPLNYRGFPKSICTSLNETICHGIPDDRQLQDGDIVNVDISVYLNGFHGDVNETYFVGDKVPEDAKKLVQVTYEALEMAIKICGPKVLYREVGPVISKHVHKNGFSVVKNYCGHGVGALFHTAPNVPHYTKNKAIGVMTPGHVFTIEPMINMGTWRDTTWPDKWTSTTMDGKLSAQFEHTLLITETGCEVLTARTKNSYKYSWLKKWEGC